VSGVSTEQRNCNTYASRLLQQKKAFDNARSRTGIILVCTEKAAPKSTIFRRGLYKLSRFAPKKCGSLRRFIIYQSFLLPVVWLIYLYPHNF
jgi:hypothetical protein